MSSGVTIRIVLAFALAVMTVAVMITTIAAGADGRPRSRAAAAREPRESADAAAVGVAPRMDPDPAEARGDPLSNSIASLLEEIRASDEQFRATLEGLASPASPSPRPIPLGAVAGPGKVVYVAQPSPSAQPQRGALPSLSELVPKIERGEIERPVASVWDLFAPFILPDRAASLGPDWVQAYALLSSLQEKQASAFARLDQERWSYLLERSEVYAKHERSWARFTAQLDNNPETPAQAASAISDLELYMARHSTDITYERARRLRLHLKDRLEYLSLDLRVESESNTGSKK